MRALPSNVCLLFSAFVDETQQFGYSLLETVFPKFKIPFFACFIQAAKYGAANSFLPSLLQTLTDDGRLRTSEGAIVPLPCKIN